MTEVERCTVHEVTYSCGAFNQLQNPEWRKEKLLRLLQPHEHTFQHIHTFLFDGPRPTAMNLTDFRDNALLKLQVGGPFTGGMIDLTNQEYVLIQVEQTEQLGQRRRRTQQVSVSL